MRRLWECILTKDKNMNNYCLSSNWKKVAVKDMGRVITGNTPPMREPENYGDDFCWTTAQDFKSKYISNTVIKLSKKGKKASRVVPAGSVLVTCIASIGLNAIAKVEMATNQQINSIIPNELHSGEFLYYLLSYNTNRLKAFAGGGGILILSKGEFEKMCFCVPPLPEQEKIAKILSCWDTAIEQMQNLIAEKKELRRALAGKLLSNDLWSDIELCELLDYEQPSKYLVTDVLDFNNDKVPVLTANKSFVIGSTDDKAGVYDKGECVIFDDFTTDMKYVDFKFKIKSSAIKILTPKSGTCLRFLFEQMRRIKYPRGGHKRYWLSEFQYLTIEVPDIGIQNKIADILTKADTEIELLNKKLDVLKEQKKGLMQKLLTGEIRVKVDKKD